MKRLVPTFALMLAFVAGAGAAAGAMVVSRAVSWPASCSTYSCVNSHLNDLKNTDFTKAVVVSHRYVFSEGEYDNIATFEACGTADSSDDRPFRGWAINGGVDISGGNAAQWHMVTSGPRNAMNSWPVYWHNDGYVSGDPLPTVTIWAICLQ